MKHFLTKMAALLLCLTLMPGTMATGHADTALQKYSTSFTGVFDTLTQVIGYAESKEAFTREAEAFRVRLQYYHRLFDIYNSYQGITNMCDVNERAGQAPVPVTGDLLDFLTFCVTEAEHTQGKVNAGLGAMLSIWHDYREHAILWPEDAALPAMEDLEAAMAHTDLQALVLNPEAATVFYSDPDFRMDVGALAKGYGLEMAARDLPDHYLISVGGNVLATGPKPTGESWVIGVQAPDSDNYVCKLNLDKGSVVTSGDYQRYFIVDGQTYHHIIDPETLMPGNKWRSVSIVCDDSGLGDALSTALFLMDLEAGRQLVQASGAEAVWVDFDGKLFMTDGFEKVLKN